MHTKDFVSETLRLLRLAGWVWLAYLAAIFVVDLFINPISPPLIAYYIYNGGSALLFLGLAYWQKGQARFKVILEALMLLLIAIFPIVINHMLVPRFPPGPLSNAEGMALRHLPVLFLGLVLVAWQYNWVDVFIYSIGITLLELITIAFFSPIQFRIFNILFVIALVRTVSFLAVGYFLSQLVSRLRDQQRSLEEANARVTHYASTLEQLTVSRERNRVARELHDTLAHSLTALAVQLETVKAYWDVDAAKARVLLDQSLASTRSGAEETRRALKALRASPLEDLGLLEALRQLAESSAARSQLDLSLSLPDNVPNLPPDVAQTVYRVAQEALENVVRHASATHLSLSLARSEVGLHLEISDDGIGFDVFGAGQLGRLGLVGLRERAALAGANIDIRSKPEQGTTITLEVPS